MVAKLSLAFDSLSPDCLRVNVSEEIAMRLENLGIDKAVRLGNPADWKATVAELE